LVEGCIGYENGVNDGTPVGADEAYARKDGCLTRRNEDLAKREDGLRRSEGGCLEKAKANPDKTKAGLEDMETTENISEERLGKMDTMDLEAVTVHQEVPKEETTVETTGALEDRYGNRHLAVGSHRQPKKRIQGDGGSRQKLAAARGSLSRRTVPVRRKGRSRKGSTVEKRRRKSPECNNGIRNRNLRRYV
jgi:hypothetical protein